jgi:hypothetical protein
MARSVQTVKTIYFSGEKKYKKEMMVQLLEARGMLDTVSKNFILRGVK